MENYLLHPRQSQNLTKLGGKQNRTRNLTKDLWIGPLAISQFLLPLTCKIDDRLYLSLAINIIYWYHFSLILWLVYHHEAIGHSLKVLSGISSVITLIYFHNWETLRSSDRIEVEKNKFLSKIISSKFSYQLCILV